MTVRHMCIACWVPKAINICSKYVTFIDFTLQQWLHKRASMLHCMYIACLVYIIKPPTHMWYGITQKSLWISKHIQWIALGSSRFLLKLADKMYV